MYDLIEAGLEKKYGLPSGGMKAIRTKGERSNADQVSPVGASTVYQIMPKTRDLFLKSYGVDAFRSKEAAAEVAALHLRDDLKRTGSWTQAVSNYHGGTDPRNHGAKTAAYTARVTGTNSPEFRQAKGRGDYTGMKAALPSGLAGLSVDQILSTDPAELGDNRRPIGPIRTSKPTPTEKKAQQIDALTGGKGVLAHNAPSLAPDLSVEQADEKRGVAAQTERESHGFLDRAVAAVEDNWVIPAMLRSMDRQHFEGDPEFHDHYVKNWNDIESFAENPRERDQLRAATSMDGLLQVQRSIQEDRARDKIKDSNGTGWAFDLGASVADPVGWVATLGVGKIVQGFGAGAKIVGSMAEGAAGNMLITGALDAAGEHTTGEDYLLSGAAGLVMGAALHPLIGRKGTDRGAEDIAKAEVANARAETDARVAQAQANLGPDAPPERVAVEANRIQDVETRDALSLSLAPIPEEGRLLSADPEAMLTAKPAVKADVTTRHALDSIADDAERNMVAEHTAKAEVIDAANPIDKSATKSVLAWGGQESTGLRLLNSGSVVARAVGISLLEGTTGAAGRRRSAAMMQAVRERLYMRPMVEFDGLYHQFRKSEGVGLISDLWDGQGRQRFNSRVYAEIERRAGQADGMSFDAHPAVNKAADLFERGMNIMRTEQQHVDVVGSARLGATSRGYLPHRLDPAKVLKLTPEQQGQVRSVLAAQFKELNEYSITKEGEKITKAYDDKFAKRLAVRYLEIAMDRAKGAYEVPFNLHSPEAADIVRDALEAMNLPKDDIEKMLGKYSRGGASHTKQRLRLDLSAEIGGGMKLQDLFVQDIVGLYRAYSRRVSGEVALAQYGIMGKKGLNILRKAISSTGGSADDVKAFDQIAAEFLNTPFGEHNHRYMDNLRIATSAARLGGMAFTQLAEYANGLAAVGVNRVFSAVGSLPRLRKEVGMLAKGGEAKNPILQSVDKLGGHLGLDEYQLSRMFDVKDNDIQLYSTERVGVFSRALRGASHLQAVASGHRMVVAVQTRGMAEQIVHKAVRYIKEGVEDKSLADMGITPAVRDAIKKDMPSIAKFDAKGNLIELDLMKGSMSGHDMMTFRDAIERGAGQIIQRTYIGETGAWAHDGLLKLLFQFRTFSLISVEKQWGRNVNNFGALKSFMYLMGSMSLAAPIHLARVHAKTVGMSRSEREEYIDKNTNAVSMARATLNYASASGLLGDIVDVGAGFGSAAGVLDDDLAQSMGARGQGRGDLIGGAIAPGVGLVEDLWTGVHGDGKKLAKALPGSNLPYVTPLITGLTAD